MSEQTKHTPGPWHDSPNNTEIHSLVFKDGIAIAQAFSRESAMSAIANARLIAAAPELLAVLKQLIPFARAGTLSGYALSDPPFTAHEHVAAALKLIDKIEGK